MKRYWVLWELLGCPKPEPEMVLRRGKCVAEPNAGAQAIRISRAREPYMTC